MLRKYVRRLACRPAQAHHANLYQRPQIPPKQLDEGNMAFLVWSRGASNQTRFASLCVSHAEMILNQGRVYQHVVRRECVIQK